MKFRQLEYFVQIVESGSLAKASRDLFVVQPALSQQLAKLEEEVGKKLFVRTSRGVTVTDNGAALYQHAKFVLRHMEQAGKIARQDSGSATGVVPIGLTPTTVSAIGVELVSHLRAKYPGITLNVIEGMSGVLNGMMRASQLDLAVWFTNSTSQDLDVSQLVEEELFVILSASSTLFPAHRTKITLAEAAALPLLLLSSSQGQLPRIAQEIERLGLALNLVAEIHSLSLLMSCVVRGVGATIQPMGATRAAAGGADLRCLRISGSRVTRKAYLYSLRDQKLPVPAMLVRDEVKAVVRKMVRSGEWKGAKLPAQTT